MNVKAFIRCILMLMVTGAQAVTSSVTFTQAKKQEPKDKGSAHMMNGWKRRWKDEIIFEDELGNKVRGRNLTEAGFREHLKKTLHTFPDGRREVLEEWLLLYKLSLRSSRAKKLCRQFFGWPPGVTWMQGATTRHYTVLWAVPASIFRLVGTAGKWRRIFKSEVLRTHTEDDGIPRWARQHIAQLIPASMYAPTPYGKCIALQWCNSNLINGEVNIDISACGQPWQWVMLPLCLRFRLACACILTWTVAEKRIPKKVKELFSDWLGITKQGVVAMQYEDFDYKKYLKC